MMAMNPLFAQNVGIGINNPIRAKFEVAGAVDRTSAIFGAEGTGVSIQRNWPSIGYNQYYNNGSKYIGQGYAAVQFLDLTYGHLVFDMFESGMPNVLANEPKRAMLISNDGRVNIGSGDYPYATLQVARGTAPAGAAIIGGTIRNSIFNEGFQEHTYIRSGRPGSVVYVNDGTTNKVIMGGTVGINTPDPKYPLEILQYVNDKGLCIVNANNFSKWEFRVTGNEGWMWLYHDDIPRTRFDDNGQLATPSDIRLKDNIVPLPGLLEKVMKLRPVSYHLKSVADNNKRSIGFIAQEVKALFPEVVSINYDSTGNMPLSDLHTLDYSSFSVIAIKTIQEQQQLINTMQAEIETIKKELNKIGKSLNNH